ncbi:hypothetical protein ACWDR0_14165 [Streptomyces sp. NPDC003691]
MPLMPRSRRRPIAVAALASALALTATGCLGGEDEKAKGPFGGKSNKEVIESASTATKAAKSLTMTAEGSMALDRTKKQRQVTIRMAIHDGGRCSGSMSVAGQGKVDIVVSGKDAYMRPDETFLRTQLKQSDETGPALSAAEINGAVGIMKGKWLKEDAASPDIKEMAEFCHLDAVLKDLGAEGTAGVERAGETTVNGQKALKLTNPVEVGTAKGKAKVKVTEELYIATSGKPYVLKIVGSPEDAEAGELITATFSDFDKAPLPKIPAPAEIIDPDKLG